MNSNTLESIMEALEDMATRKEPIAPHLYLEGAVKLNALLQNTIERKYEIESRLNKMRAAYLEEGKTAAFAKGMIEAQDEWLEHKKLSALIERALATIQLAKKYATLTCELNRSM